MSGQKEESGPAVDADDELLALEALLSADLDVDPDQESAEKAALEKAATSEKSRTKDAADMAQSLVRKDNVDSSDEEDVQNFLDRKYNEYGSEINNLMKQQSSSKAETRVEREVTSALSGKRLANSASPSSQAVQQTLSSFNFKRLNTKPAPMPASPTIGAASTPILTDPVFGLRIINPLVSSALLVERMAGRKAVSMCHVSNYIQTADLSKDWVIAGVLVKKGPVRNTKKGDPFAIWQLSDLRGDMRTVSLFLFKSAYKDLWKTPEGMCLAVLNPNVFHRGEERNSLASLSIDMAQKVMILGKSKDLGVCKARKKNGDPCSSTVNLSECDVCVFHLKQEYGKMSRRSELQSSGAGSSLDELRRKILGKSEVFYGGQSFMATPAKPSPKLIKKDNDRMSTLSEYATAPYIPDSTRKPTALKSQLVPYAERTGPISRVASSLETTTKQRQKDLQMLKKLSDEMERDNTSQPSVGSQDSLEAVKSSTASSPAPVNEKFKNMQFSFSSFTPKLSQENFSIEVNIGGRKAQMAKKRAMDILKKRPIEKVDPNSIRGSKDGKRRAIDELNEQFCSFDAKRQRREAEETQRKETSRIERIMNALSSHTNLIDQRREEEQNQYFSKLEKKEALEEKMAKTFEIPCKAVTCLQCKYTAFSAAPSCKENRHRLKVTDAKKRFFKCKDCGNRTATVFKLPKTSCSNCKGSRWERAAMKAERKVAIGPDALSIRGDEETFIGSMAGSSSLNLLVPVE